MGNASKILLRPKLIGNAEYPVTLKAMKNSNITVEMKNQEGIPNNFTVKNVQWDPKNEYVLEIPIQFLLKSLSLSVDCEI